MMAKSKGVKANEKVKERATATFSRIENTFVGDYTIVENAFVDRYLTKDGETVEEAKVRLKQWQNHGINKSKSSRVSQRSR